MKKRNYWPYLFIGIFGFTFSMIIWTIVSAVGTPVYEDKSFLNSYQNVDANFNNIIESNEAFKKVYDAKIVINETSFALVVDDIYKSQRVIEKKSTHKDIFYKGKNIVSFDIKDKNSNDIKDYTVDFRISKAISDESDIDLSNKDNGKSSFDFELPIEGNWIITGIIETNDKQKGYFYIKSNAIRK